jgi:hypothetical protein
MKASVEFEAVDYDLSDQHYENFGRGAGPSVDEVKAQQRQVWKKFDKACKEFGVTVSNLQIEYQDEVENIWSCGITGDLSGPDEGLRSLAQAAGAGDEQMWSITDDADNLIEGRSIGPELSSKLDRLADGADDVEYDGKSYMRAGPADSTKMPGPWRLVKREAEESHESAEDVAKKMLGEEESGIELDLSEFPDEDEDKTDIGRAIEAAEAAADAGKPVTVSFGPQSLKAIAYFLLKPNHDKAVQQMHHALIEAFLN